MDNGASSYSRYLVGDDSALGDIVREYKDGLTIYLNSFTNNILDAEELMEETFFKLAYKKPKYTGKSSFKTWLYLIVTPSNRSRDPLSLCDISPFYGESLRQLLR